MAKKNDAQTPPEPDWMKEDEEVVDPKEALNNLDFNVKDEYKPDPLLLQRSYRANVVKVSFNPKQSSIVWTGCIVDSDAVMSDGETSADGTYIVWNNWLPRPGDELELIKDGKKTKRQSKINMLEDYQRKLGIDMSTPQIIAQSILEQSWVGLTVVVDVVISEWEGRTRNEVKKVSAA
jgi:hypothetical protein